jgi:DNA helicase II / ATP-dependent DNA helicase PcrA
MKFAADLHVHSRLSRATSSEADLAGYFRWAQVKGIALVGTGDFTHPRWLAELAGGLVEDNGLYRLKDPPKDSPLAGARPADSPVRFIPTVEISSIYKKTGRTRKVHSLLGVPTLEDARRLSVKLAAVGNIASDGRPILGLDPRDLFEMLLETAPDGFLVPAHIWTPWFSLFGSKSGFDAIEECFEDLTPMIHALETGLSSDPPMNRLWSALDRYRLVSSSDAHSPSRLGREATLFDTELTYEAVTAALRTGEGFRGTVEFYPEEGKYHLDGHRACGVCMDPAETRQAGGRCPACGRPVTVGVLSRVLELADRREPVVPRPDEGFTSVIPLPELLGELVGTGAGSRAVASLYEKVIARFGSEFAFLLDADLEEIERSFGGLLGESVRRMRQARINPTPGYDGEFGVVRVFAEGELERLRGQDELFARPARGGGKARRPAGAPAGGRQEGSPAAPRPNAAEPALDADQQAVVDRLEGTSLVFAGPGTGKTRVLTRWIARQARRPGVRGVTLALTFTNRAADEMRSRLAGEQGVTVSTFHSFCWSVLRESDPSLTTVFGREDRHALLRMLFPDRRGRVRAMADALEKRYEGAPGAAPDGLDEIARAYEAELAGIGAADISSLVPMLVHLLAADHGLLTRLQTGFRAIAVDELQDVNAPQYALLRLLVGRGEPLPVLCIGDPDQAIYGFRGSDRELFFRFRDESGARVFGLSRSYRSSGAILAAASGVLGPVRAPGGGDIAAARAFGERVSLFAATDPDEEAGFIAERIRDLVGGVDAVSVDSARGRGHGEEAPRSFSDFAVLFRTRAVRDSLLPGLARAGLPLAAQDSVPLTSEPPFSHLVAAMRLLLNPADSVSAETLRGRLTEPEGFAACRADLLRTAADESVEALVGKLLADHIAIDRTDPAISLGEEAIRSAARMAGADLAGFLARVSLCTLESEAARQAERVTLLTFHAAKGLEFPVVFIAGAEEGITPLPEHLDEERRLFYVAMTRAGEKLFITRSCRRTLHGSVREMQASRFLADLPPTCVQEESPGKKKGRRRGDPRSQGQMGLFG